MRVLIATLTALMLFATTPVTAGDYWDRKVAAQAGDYQKTYRLWKRSAEKGYVRVEFNLGRMYYEGNGVPENHAKAIHWFTKAAKQGRTNAQCNLGTMYANGWGVLQDYMPAYAWFSVAAAQGDVKGKE